MHPASRITGATIFFRNSCNHIPDLTKGVSLTERKIFLVITIKSISQTVVNVSVNSHEWSFYAPVANVNWHLNLPLIIPLVWISLKHHSIICWKMYVAGISRPMSLFLCLSVTVTEIRPLWFMNKWLPCIPIHKHAEPRSFKGSNMDLLPENYKWQKNSWTDSVIFEEWVRKVDPRRWKQQTGRSCCVLITTQHWSQCAELDKHGTRLRFFPPNCTSKLYSADQGIIQNLKVHYRQIMIRKP